VVADDLPQFGRTSAYTAQISRCCRALQRMPDHKFTEPVAFSSTFPVNLRLPPTALGSGFDLLTLRARCLQNVTPQPWPFKRGEGGKTPLFARPGWGNPVDDSPNPVRASSGRRDRVRCGQVRCQTRKQNGDELSTVSCGCGFAARCEWPADSCQTLALTTRERSTALRPRAAWAGRPAGRRKALGSFLALLDITSTLVRAGGRAASGV
jgi:hypothetical protein